MTFSHLMSSMSISMHTKSLNENDLASDTRPLHRHVEGCGSLFYSGRIDNFRVKKISSADYFPDCKYDINFRFQNSYALGYLAF